jgi:DNA-binding IclR family transcriptional regulator
MTDTLSKAPAIARAAAILRLLGRSDAPLGVNAIARELGLVPSTCLYVLRALAGEELVEFDPDTKRYSLGVGVLTLARGWLGRDRFADLAQPALERLAREHGVTTMGVQITGLEHIVVVAAVQGGANVQLAAQVGSRFPALLSATGRCIAAFGGYPLAQLEAKFRTLRWDDPPEFADWQQQVEQTRAQGFGVDQGNYIAGITVVAAPVWQASGRPSHALVGIGLASALGDGDVSALGEALAAAARSLSGQMGG